jgi:hypothetical protein
MLPVISQKDWVDIDFAVSPAPGKVGGRAST